MPFIGLLAVFLLPFVAEAAPANAGEVNIYSHRHYEVDKQLFAMFTEKTGIQVNVVKASADQLLKRLEIEGEDSPADVLITVDAGRLYRAKEQGLLQPIASEELDKHVPAHLRDPEGYWYGLTTRARVIVYAKDRVKQEELSSYEALADEKWQGRILVRSSQNIYNQSLMASITYRLGEEEAREWAKAIVRNMARQPKGNDRDQVKAVVAGVGDLAIVNTYYLGNLLYSDDESERAVGKQVGIFFPNQADRGTHINVSGAGITRHAKNKEAAIAFLEFLISPEAQGLFAEANYEYPVRAGVESCNLLRSWGAFKQDDINLSNLGKYNEQAVKVFDEVGWK